MKLYDRFSPNPFDVFAHNHIPRLKRFILDALHFADYVCKCDLGGKTDSVIALNLKNKEYIFVYRFIYIKNAIRRQDRSDKSISIHIPGYIPINRLREKTVNSKDIPLYSEYIHNEYIKRQPILLGQILFDTFKGKPCNRTIVSGKWE